MSSLKIALVAEGKTDYVIIEYRVKSVSSQNIRFNSASTGRYIARTRYWMGRSFEMVHDDQLSLPRSDKSRSNTRSL